MRAWAAKATGRGRDSFCEQCGATGTVRARRQVADRPRERELLVCRGCSLLTCLACWPGPFLTCRACCLRENPVLVTLVGEAPPAKVAGTRPGSPAVGQHRTRRGRPAVLAAAAVLALAVVGGAIAFGRPDSGAGGVAGLTARATPSAAPSGDPRAGSATPSATPSRTTDPGPEPTRSSDPTPRPGTPAELTVTASAVRPWVDPVGEVRAQVLVGVTNQGGSPGYLPSSATAWEVLSSDGSPIAHGRFAHVFPPLVEPGATAWLVDAVSATFTEPGELHELRITLEAAAPKPDDVEAGGGLLVRDVEWRVDDSGAVSVSGVVENVGSRSVGRWAAGVVLVAADGAPLAAAYEVGEVDGLEPGETAQFTTAYPGSAPVAEDSVATVVAVAVPLD